MTSASGTVRDAANPKPSPVGGSETRPNPSGVELRDVVQRFQPDARKPAFTALKDVSVTVPGGQFVSIVGPTGCGKSTMLSAISGLRPPSEGQVWIGGERVNGVRRDVGFVFQHDALLPWRTALQNVELALRFRGVHRKEARDRGREWLARVGLASFESSYPHQLSGGMRKRTAIAATLVYEPSVLLMDEPFSSLDVQTRNIMENDLLGMWQETGHQTVMFVTHDLEEAIGLSDRVIVLTASPGRVLGDYEVPLPRPRNLLAVKMDEQFIELYRKIWADLEGEVVKASQMAQQTPA
jgi:NitT/TauT family transport system ATP-binding protein